MRPLHCLPAVGLFLAAGFAAGAPIKGVARREGGKEPSIPASGTPSPAITAGVSSRLAPARVRALAESIDACVEKGLAKQGLAVNPPAVDGQFLRRIYLDVAGRIPTAWEAESFLADRAPDKRAKLADHLLGSSGHTMRQFNFLADMLRVKDQYNRGSGLLYADWLKARIADGTPWDALVRQMVCAEGKLCENGATGFLLRDADMPLDGMSNLMTTFLGANMACAQCHDHPFAEWSQKDFYQMAAFFGATNLRDGKAARQVLRQKEEDLPIPKQLAQRIVFSNVMQAADEKRNHMRLPADYKYDDAKPKDLVTPQFMAWHVDDAMKPLYQADLSNPALWRVSFAAWLTSPDNPRFAANIANRTWKKIFGQGVREPVGDLDDLSAASNPELLEALAKVMKETRFDLREFERVVLSTRAYQAAAHVPSSGAAYAFQGPLLRRMTAEQAWDSIVLAAVGPDVDDIREQRGKILELTAIPGNDFSDENLKAAAARLQQAGFGGRGAFAPKDEGKAAKQSERMADALEKNTGSGGGKKKEAGGMMNAKMVGAILNNYTGPRPKGFGGAGLLVRASELQQPAPETHFLRVFGQSPRLIPDASAKDGSVPQALALMNGPVSRVVTDRQCEALRQAQAQKDPEAQITRLWLAFYARWPAPSETQAAQAALKGGATLADLAWALVNSHEFLFVR